MVKKITILTLCFPLLMFAQQKQLTYDQSNDIKFVKEYKNNTLIDSYTTKYGLKINIGDTLTIGNAVIDRKKYMFHDVFSHIVVGNNKRRTNKVSKQLPHNYSGSKVIVKSLFVTHEKYSGYKLWPNRDETPLYVSVFVKGTKKGFSKILGYSRKTIIDIEKALLSGEILSHNNQSLMGHKADRVEDFEEENIKKDNKKYNLLLKLGKLKESGLLTEEEFEKEKKKILNDY